MAKRPRLDADFRYLFRVCEEALKYGDSSPAETLLHLYRTEVAREGRIRGSECERWKRKRKLYRPGERASEAVSRTLAGQRHPEDEIAKRGERLEVARAKVQRLAKLIAANPVRLEAMPRGFDPPTPQTTVKIRARRDPLANMKLNRGQERAARIIRQIFEATVATLEPKGMPLVRIRVDTSIDVRDPTRTISVELAELRNAVYLPWCAEYDSTLFSGDGGRLTTVDLVLTVLIDRVGFRDFEKRYGRNASYFSDAFKSALSRFNRRLGPFLRERDRKSYLPLGNF